MDKNIGIKVETPKNKCEDPKCPFHGQLKLRGRTFTGEVVSDKLKKNATVVWQRWRKIPKYERFEKRYSKVHAYNPDCIAAKQGDKVLIAECRPLSKTKNFVVVQIITDQEEKNESN